MIVESSGWSGRYLAIARIRYAERVDGGPSRLTPRSSALTSQRRPVGGGRLAGCLRGPAGRQTVDAALDAAHGVHAARV